MDGAMALLRRFGEGSGRDADVHSGGKGGCIFRGSDENAVAKDGSARVTKLGMTFPWVAEHVGAEEMRDLRKQSDDLSDAALAAVRRAGLSGDPLLCILELSGMGTGLDGLLDLARAVAERGPDSVFRSGSGISTVDEGAAACRRFLLDAYTVPSWVDDALLREGQRFYTRFAPLAGICLFFISLVGGFSAPHIVEVLAATGYLTGPDPQRIVRRILETGYFLSATVSRSGGAADPVAAADGGGYLWRRRSGVRSLAPGNEGWLYCCRVRLMHASARAHVLEVPSYVPSASGHPVNQGDLGATLLSFSINVILGVEAILGRSAAEREKAGYLHLWRYMAHLLGISEAANWCAADSSVAMRKLESVIVHLIEPEHRKVQELALNLISAPGRAHEKARDKRRPAAAAAPSAGNGGAAGHPDATRHGSGGGTCPDISLPAQVFAFFLGNDWATALGFVPPGERPRLATRLQTAALIWTLRIYGNLCTLPICGDILVWCHDRVMDRFLGEMRRPSFALPSAAFRPRDGRMPMRRVQLRQ